MFKLNFKEYFLKKYVKLTKCDQKLDDKIRKTLNKLKDNPKDSSLYSHQVISKQFGKLWSSKVTGDLRIIWTYNDDQVFVLDIFDIGGHEGSKSVYK